MYRDIPDVLLLIDDDDVVVVCEWLEFVNGWKRLLLSESKQSMLFGRLLVLQELVNE